MWMTKRFTAIRKKNPVSKEMGNYIQDDETTILKLSSFEDCKDIVGVLNNFDCEFKHLQEENEQLKEIITGQRDTIKRDNEWENNAIEEIKQLKQYKQAVNDVLDSYYQRDLTPIEEILVGGIARELNIDLHYKYKGDVE